TTARPRARPTLPSRSANPAAMMPLPEHPERLEAARVRADQPPRSDLPARLRRDAALHPGLPEPHPADAGRPGGPLPARPGPQPGPGALRAGPGDRPDARAGHPGRPARRRGGGAFPGGAGAARADADHDARLHQLRPLARRTSRAPTPVGPRLRLRAYG